MALVSGGWCGGAEMNPRRLLPSHPGLRGSDWAFDPAGPGRADRRVAEPPQHPGVAVWMFSMVVLRGNDRRQCFPSLTSCRIRRQGGERLAEGRTHTHAHPTGRPLARGSGALPSPWPGQPSGSLESLARELDAAREAYRLQVLTLRREIAASVAGAPWAPGIRAGRILAAR